MRQTQTIKDMMIPELHYLKIMNESVVPYIDAIKKTGYLTGVKGISLYYETYHLPDAKGTVVISHGMGENLDKYDEMIYYYLLQGYSVYGMEHRGHGRSGRLGIDSTQVSIDSFDNYVKDLKHFLDKVVLPQSGENKLFLFAHSMGGGIGTRFLEKYPEYFDAAILSSPMHGVNTFFLPKWVAKRISNRFAKGEDAHKYALGNRPYNPTYDFEAAYTSCETRFKWSWKLKVDDPRLRMGGGSYKWVSECMKAVTKLVRPSEARKVKIPVLLFQSGKDILVDNKGHKKFADNAKNCKVIQYEDSKHELFTDRNEVLLDYLTNIFTFLDENS